MTNRFYLPEVNLSTRSPIVPGKPYRVHDRWHEDREGHTCVAVKDNPDFWRDGGLFPLGMGDKGAYFATEDEAVAWCLYWEPDWDVWEQRPETQELAVQARMMVPMAPGYRPRPEQEEAYARGNRICLGCKIEKPLIPAHFTRDTCQPTGFNARCKPCLYAARKQAALDRNVNRAR